jgi:hypothetical protein
MIKSRFISGCVKNQTHINLSNVIPVQPWHALLPQYRTSSSSHTTSTTATTLVMSISHFGPQQRPLLRSSLVLQVVLSRRQSQRLLQQPQRNVSLHQLQCQNELIHRTFYQTALQEQQQQIDGNRMMQVEQQQQQQQRRQQQGLASYHSGCQRRHRSNNSNVTLDHTVVNPVVDGRNKYTSISTALSTYATTWNQLFAAETSTNNSILLFSVQPDKRLAATTTQRRYKTNSASDKQPLIEPVRDTTCITVEASLSGTLTMRSCNAFEDLLFCIIIIWSC